MRDGTDDGSSSDTVEEGHDVGARAGSGSEDMPRHAEGASPQRFVRDVWYAVLESRGLGRKPVSVTRLGRRLVLWRDGQGRAVAQQARCPHRGADLGRGRVVDGCLECPYHGFRFASHGACVLTPCEGRGRPIRGDLRVESWPVREAHGFVWLWWGAPREQLPEVPWFEALPPDGTPGHTSTMQWQAPFARAMEGMLDMHHVPFAHRKVLWGVGPLLDPYEVRLEGDVLRSRGVLRKDDGQPYGGQGGTEVELHVHLPHLVYLCFGGMRGMAAVTPIDEEHTWIALRYTVPLPVLGWPLAWLMVQLELRLVQPEDELLLSTSTPRVPERQTQCLVRADAAISLWHRLYARRLRAQAREDAARQAPAHRTRPEPCSASLKNGGGG